MDELPHQTRSPLVSHVVVMGDQVSSSFTSKPCPLPKIGKFGKLVGPHMVFHRKDLFDCADSTGIQHRINTDLIRIVQSRGIGATKPEQRHT